MAQLLFYLLKSVRPRQALKNLAILAPLVFSGNLFNPSKIFLAIWATFIFTLVTSSIYLLNDIVDLPFDRLHPFKKRRPLASGNLPIPIALFVAITSLFVALYLAYLFNFFLFLATLTYVILQVAYTFYLKNLVVLDVITIAGGFVLRVYAGALAINVHMNVWFLLCVVSLALYLAVGKRRSELAILDKKIAPHHRKTFIFYSQELLDSYLAMFANSAWMAYALFTFFTSPPPVSRKPAFFAYLPLTLAGTNKWLMLTIPVVIYGVMRYMSIIYQGSRAESPEKVVLSDRPLLAAIVVWGIMVVIITYGLNP